MIGRRLGKIHGALIPLARGNIDCEGSPSGAATSRVKATQFVHVSNTILTTKTSANMAAVPAGKTWFDTLKTSFDNVDVGPDQGIDTSSFLEASEATTTLFGKHPL